MLYNKTIFKRCFCYRPRYWYKNLAQIPRYFRDLHFLIKHGYDVGALWSVESWFNGNIKEILEWLRKNKHGIPTYELEEGFFPETDEDWEKQEQLWNGIMDQMIFLAGEMDEETCQRKNPYDEERSRCHKEFIEKYGLLGEGLATEEEKAELEPQGLKRWHSMSELPEYKEIFENWLNEERELEKYREDCKNRFFEMFSKYYYSLWD